MERILRDFLKNILIVLLSSLVAYSVANCWLSEWNKSNPLAILLDSSIYAKLFDVAPRVHKLLLILTSMLLGLITGASVASYPQRLVKSHAEVGANWHHYVVSAFAGLAVGVGFFLKGIIVADTWFAFKADAILIVMVFIVWGSLLSERKPSLNHEKNVQLPQDLIGVNNTVDYISRRIGSALNGTNSPLPNTLAIVGDRGSGKSYILEKVVQKIRSDFEVPCKLFKPWDFDSHSLLYEEVLGYIFLILEQKYVVPKPKALVETYIRSFCDEPKKVLDTFMGQLFGTFSSEKRTLQDIQEWLGKVGNVVIVFDDLDRCHQSEIRSVLRLMDRLSIFRNIFIVVSLDDRTIEKVGKFDDRVEIPVKVAS